MQIREEVVLIPNPRGPLLKPEGVKIRISATKTIITITQRVWWRECGMMRAAEMPHLLIMHSLPNRTRTAYLSFGEQAEARSVARVQCGAVFLETSDGMNRTAMWGSVQETSS